jgi:hypothetical protein
MFGLARAPISFWFLFSLVMAYATYNPWFCLVDVLQYQNMFWGFKAIICFVFGAIFAIYISEGGKAFSVIGLLILLALIGAVVVTGLHTNWLSLGTIKYWGQIPVAVVMTVALRGASVYRMITGRVPVGTTTVDHDGDTHHG